MRFQFILIAFFTLTFDAAWAQLGGGSGTANDPYIIATASNLDSVRYFLANPNLHFRQTADIDLNAYQSGNGWNPIGSDAENQRFNGNYDGQGFKISNLTINRPNQANVGLFSTLGTTGKIRNLGIQNVNVVGARATGSLVGRVRGSANTLIEYCWADGGSVAGDGATGGLVGANNSVQETPGGEDNPILSKSYANINVSLRSPSSAGKDKIGGLVGCNQKGTTINSYARGNVLTGTESGTTRVGGLAGCTELRGIIINSYATGQVSGGTLVGGLVGNLAGQGGNAGVVTGSYWDTQSSGTTTSAGGTGKTTEEMKVESTFVGWDFDGGTWETDPNINESYPYLFTIQSTQPVELIFFRGAVLQNRFVELKWATATDYENSHFLIERSINGLDFMVIGRVAGNGTTVGTTHYSFIDYRPARLDGYYRLVQVDFDGTSKTYETIRVQLDTSKKTITLMQNPVQRNKILLQVNVNGPNVYQMQIINLSGAILLSQELLFDGFFSEVREIDGLHLASGIYLLVLSNNQERILERIIVE
jgi:hypothetical protein